MLVAFCLWTICAGYLLRTTLVLLGLGDREVGEVMFFALVGTNVVGSIYAVISLRFD